MRKNNFLAMVLIFLSCLILAQERNHTVLRGETVSSIARKYGVSENEIRQQNKIKSECYVGQTLKIPSGSYGVQTQYNGNVTSGADVSASAYNKVSAHAPVTKPLKEKVDNTAKFNNYALLQEAISYYNTRNYLKAVKLLNKSIKVKPTGLAHYYRGCSYYKQNNYKAAKEDLYVAQRSDDLDNHYKKEARRLYADANKKIDEQKAASRQAWANFGKGVGAALLVTGAVVGAAAVDAYTAPNTYNTYTPATASGGSYSSGGSSSSSSSSYNSGSSSSSSSKTDLCLSCCGNGKCPQCHGSGCRTDNQFGTGTDYSKKCGICGGSGICKKCNGAGRIARR